MTRPSSRPSVMLSLIPWRLRSSPALPTPSGRTRSTTPVPSRGGSTRSEPPSGDLVPAVLQARGSQSWKVGYLTSLPPFPIPPSPLSLFRPALLPSPFLPSLPPTLFLSPSLPLSLLSHPPKPLSFPPYLLIPLSFPSLPSSLLPPPIYSLYLPCNRIACLAL